MTPFVALIRGINVGGHHPLDMADLRKLLTRQGFLEVKSLLQSGNLLFRAGGRSASELEAQLEKETEKRFSMQVDFLVRTAEEWGGIIRGNPFPAEAAADPGHLVVMCFKEPVKSRALAALRDANVAREVVKGTGRQLYIFYPDGIGRSRLTHGLIEKVLDTRGTGRNWNTVMKIGGLVAAG